MNLFNPTRSLFALMLMLVATLAQAHGPRGYRHGWGPDPWLGPVVVGSAMVGTSIYLSRSYPVVPASTVVITNPPVVVVNPASVTTWSGVQAAAPAAEAYYCRESAQYFPVVQTCISPWLVVYPQR